MQSRIDNFFENADAAADADKAAKIEGQASAEPEKETNQVEVKPEEVKIPAKKKKKSKFIDDEAEEEEGEYDDEDDYDDEYEEDEGKDDEGSAEAERELHRGLRIKKHGHKKHLKAIKDEEDKAVAKEIAQEKYQEDSFVKDEIEYISSEDDDLLKKKRKRLVKSKIIIDEDDEPVKEKPEEVKPEEIKPEEVKPEEVKPEEVKPEEIKPEEVKPEEVKPEEVKPEEIKPVEVKPEEVKPEEVKPEEVKSEEIEPEEVKSEKVKPFESKPYNERSIAEKIALYQRITGDLDETLIDMDEMEAETHIRTYYINWLRDTKKHYTLKLDFQNIFGRKIETDNIDEIKQIWAEELGVGIDFKAKYEEKKGDIEAERIAKEEENLVKSIDLKINMKNKKLLEDMQGGRSDKFHAIGKGIDCKGFGIVIYMTKTSYTGIPDQDINIHIPHEKKIFFEVIVRWLKMCGIESRNIEEIVIGHEHGDKNKKCHMQCYLHFDDRVRNKLYPGEFNIDLPKNLQTSDKKLQNYIMMSQPEHNQHALKNYCEKENDYWFKENATGGWGINTYISYEGKVPFSIQLDKDDKENIYSLLAKAGTRFDKETIKPYLQQSDRLARDAIIYGIDKILDNINKITKVEEEIPKFKWHLPEYITNYIKEWEALSPEEKVEKWKKDINAESRYEAFKMIKTWFFRYCVNNDRENFTPGSRKKGLFLFGPRGTGKTTLALSLVDDINKNIMNSPFIVYCRQNVTAKNFQNKEQTAQLIVLDDVDWVDKKKEMIKALITGGATNIESKNVDNYIWNYNCPCIIISNCPATYNYFNNNSEWNEDIMRIGSAAYLGPEGTQQEHRENECYIDPIMQAEVDKWNEYIRKKKEAKEARQAPIAPSFNTIVFKTKKKK